MITAFIYGITVAVVLLVIGIMSVFWMLRYRDDRLGIDFKNDIIGILKKNPIAMSIWAGAWVIGCFMFAAAIAGRFA